MATSSPTSGSYELRVHRDWIGPLQPVGLVVSPPALVAAQAFPDQNIIPQQQALLALVTPREPDERDQRRARARREPALLPLRFEELATEVLGWRGDKLAGAVGGAPLPQSLDVVLPELGETLRPTYAIPAHKDDGADWLLLVQELAEGTPLDEVLQEGAHRWQASPQMRLERLLRETGVPIGVLTNGRSVRLVYAPRGESSGHVTWPVHALCEVAGRPVLSALCMLLGAPRLFSLPREQRLPHILKESRKYQNVVSTQLAGQVLEALNELLRGFQSANAAAHGRLLDEVVREDPEHVYGGLLAVLLRLVFALYAEERGLLSSSPIYVRSYSLVGLFEKLRADAGRFPDTMDQRHGAWSRLLVLFRLVHDGGGRGELKLPARHGHLFDPDAWPFLEGRSRVGARQVGGRLDVPRVADGVVLRVLEKLLLLDGDRLSYRALDVEQIGSVYENMMGFRLERALETSIGVGKEHVVIGLDTLLGKRAAERDKHLKEAAGIELSGKAAEALREARTLEDLVAALARRISPLTPRAVPLGGFFLQPTDERRRSGSHYTPRELTEPIVRTTLRPILEDLGPCPRPDQILALTICDPAMGSGAFLVETCRQLAEQLVRAYDIHGRPTDVPPDEDILLYAQRQVAQRCLYGVDRNPFAVDLGKLSLWLATLAKGHSFSFLDHAIRHGDSLVGLSREQIASFNWAEEQQIPTVRALIDKALGTAEEKRRAIQALSASDDDFEKRTLLREAEEALADVRLIGDCVVASFFRGESDRERRALRQEWQDRIGLWVAGRGDRGELEAFADELRAGDRGVPCFHWEVEFPEVFHGPSSGFAGVVGNPPYVGGTLIGSRLGLAYHDFVVELFQPATGLADLVAFFIRRAFGLVREGGTVGFVTTNTIAQGDTRRTGLEAIIRRGGTIYYATRRYPWPGLAAVVASVSHLRKGSVASATLDARSVARISSFLLASSAEGAPALLPENAGRCYRGAKVWGSGFLFEPEPSNGSSSLADMECLIGKDPRNREVIFPYIGGEEFNESPQQRPIRYVIDFARMPMERARRWPSLFALVEERVKPVRATNKQRNYREEWWLHANRAAEVAPFLRESGRALALSAVSKHLTFAFVGEGTVVADSMLYLCVHRDGDFATLQCRLHEVWARFLGSTLGVTLRYTTTCFETFPRPSLTAELEDAGRRYYCERSDTMKAKREGFTQTYNRFHDPEETAPDILRLRELHAAMDRAVLDAYGWGDIQPTCEFLLDYEEEEDNPDAGSARRKKKPWRYRWPDEIRDEVLGRLLDLNAKRARSEAEAAPTGGAGGDAPSPARPRKAKAPRDKATEKAPVGRGQGSLFDGEGE